MHAIPMQEEVDAVDAVALVYRDIRTVSAVVPSPFKSMAINPAYLELAWAQIKETRSAIVAMAEELAQYARSICVAADSPKLPAEAHESLLSSAFLVPQTLLMVELLSALLEGSIEERPRKGAALRLAAGSEETIAVPAIPMISQSDATSTDREMYTEIQEVYGIPFVSSIFKILAAKQQLRGAWDRASAFQSSQEGRDLAEMLGARARSMVTSQIQDGFAGPGALSAMGELGSRGSLVQLLDIYRQGIPQVLVFVSLGQPSAAR